MTTIRRFTAHDTAGVRRLYETSFPAAIRVAWDELLLDLALGSATLVVAHEDPAESPDATGDEGTVVGLAALHTLPSVQAGVLSYLTVAHDSRGRGVGPRLVEAVQDLAADQGSTQVLVEAEPTVGTATSPVGDPVPSLAFLLQAGGRLLSAHYARPDLSAEDPEAVVDRYLITLPADPDTLPDDDEVVELAGALWGPEYYGRPDDDRTRTTILTRVASTLARP